MSNKKDRFKECKTTRSASNGYRKQAKYSRYLTEGTTDSARKAFHHTPNYSV